MHHGAIQRAVEVAWQEELRDGGGASLRRSGPVAVDKARYLRERGLFLDKHHSGVFLPQAAASPVAVVIAPTAPAALPLMWLIPSLT